MKKDRNKNPVQPVSGTKVPRFAGPSTFARLPELRKVANKFDLKIISIEDLVAYRMEHDSLIQKKQDYNVETRFGSFRLRAYQQTTNDAVHIALTKGTWSTNEMVPTRINSTLVNNDILGTLTNNADHKLDKMFKQINENSKKSHKNSASILKNKMWNFLESKIS